MRKIEYISLILPALVLFLASCSPSGKEGKARDNGVEIFFEEFVHDFGEIEQDSDGTWNFRFKNLGKEAIVINRVRSTCGCTVPEWPEEPLKPGSEGSIAVKYNTANAGIFSKSIFVYSSAANSPVKLQIKGKVVVSGQ